MHAILNPTEDAAPPGGAVRMIVLNVCFRVLTTSHCLVLGWVSISRHFDAFKRSRDAFQIIGIECEIGCCQVFFDPVQLSRSRDRHNPWFLGKEPRERYLARGRALGRSGLL